MANKKSNKKSKVVLSLIDKEKATVVYMSLVEKHKEHIESINCRMFIKTWIKMFECDKYNRSPESKNNIREKQIAGFRFAKENFKNKSSEEITDFRNSLIIYPNREVPVELKRLGQDKGVFVSLADDITKHLSGFGVFVKDRKSNKIHEINTIPFGLSEDKAQKLLETLPTTKELVQQEIKLARMLNDDDIPVADKKEAVNQYKAPYATHEFKKIMFRYTMKECKNQQLTLFCVNLCRRVGIENMSNGLPIEYKYCVGSGKKNKHKKKKHKRKKK